MKNSLTTYLLLAIFLLLGVSLVDYAFAALSVPQWDWDNRLNASWGDVIDQIQSIGNKWLSLARVIIAGIAIIYMVYIGADMILNNGNEENIKRGKKQILYTMIGFLFLNTGVSLVKLFSCKASFGSCDTVIYNNAEASIFLKNIITFLEVLTFGLSILILTYAAFQLIVSGGNDEKKKLAKNRFVYGVLGLVVLMFIEFWGGIVSSFDMTGVRSTFSRILNIALFFAGPVAIFFLK